MSISSVYHQPTHQAPNIHQNQALEQDGGYSDCDGGYPAEQAAAPEPIVFNALSGPGDGPEGYHHNGPYPNVDQFISTDGGRTTLRNSFFSRYFSHATTTWGYNIIQTIGNHFGRFSVQRLGSGVNSSAFVMQEEGTQRKHVLRTFSVRNLRHEHHQKAFQLSRDHVGGEWTSGTFNHPNLASNTHLVVWDSADNSFRVMDQNQVQHLIANRHTMQPGRQLYAVATIAEYVEGSQDLDRYLSENPQRSEEEIRDILQGTLQGVAEMNRHQTIHRDLKAANIIRLPTGETQLIDFGSVGLQNQDEDLPFFGDRCVHPIDSFYKISGIEPHTNKKTDTYSLFLVTYQAITGRKFFGANSNNPQEIKLQHRALIEKERATNNFQTILDEDPLLKNVSQPLKNLMAQLGTASEKRRLTAEEALTHPFFAPREIEQLQVA
ncbi:protein kinase domain-containing protein [Simkania sp.]|uniref:protein kinase domain-containing protein n=1 Tax=Simkania sp. TaxID=34094 RepID=UPI003B52FA8C